MRSLSYPRRIAATYIVIPTLAAALCCGGDTPTTPEPEVASDAGEAISGRERLGWQQPTLGTEDGSALTFVAFVDGQLRGGLKNVSCARAGAVLDCSSDLPELTAGRHVLELAAVRRDSGAEGSRSSPLVVTVAGS